MSDRIRVGWLAPEDCVLPLQAMRGSITNDIWQLSRRLRDRCDILMATKPHPALGTVDVTVDGIRYVRADTRADLRRAELVHRLNQAQRVLGLPDLPYAGRPSYFRTYADRHVARFRAEGVDVIHLHNNSQWVSRIRRALPDVPVVLQMHSEWLAEIPLRTGRERLTQVDRVLAVSNQIADQIRDRYPEVAERLEVLWNGIDVSEFPDREDTLRTRRDEVAELRAQLGLGDDPVVLFVGRISAEKGLHTLVEALPAVLRRVPDARVVMFGQFAGLRSPLPTRDRRELSGHPEWRAHYAECVQRLAARFGDRVVFPGRIPAASLPVVHALASVYVQPSLFEAFPLAVIEAMASGLPVVASEAGGMPEQVVDGETGYLVPPLEPAALGDAITRVLLDPDLARRLGRAGRARVARSITWDQSAERLYEVYRGLLGKDGSSWDADRAGAAA